MKLAIILMGVVALLSACASPTPRVFEPAPFPKIVSTPGKSFWRDQVVYPHPVAYATLTDTQDQDWRIAYIDAFKGKDPAKAPTLVLVHGRAANSGYWMNLMEQPLQAGMRVISIDMPNYGKSIPDNQHLPYQRSLQDIRVMLKQLVVDQLGITKAHYLGHSMGGQVVLGYALDYPEHVNSIVLYAPAGLEYTRPKLAMGDTKIDYINPKLQYDFDAWKTVWAPIGVLDASVNASEQALIDRFTKTPNPSKRAYLQRTDPLASYFSQLRIIPKQSHPEEERRHAITMATDVYNIVMENNADSPNSLVNRSQQLSVPVFLALGGKDPAVPLTWASGNKDVRMELAKPFFDRVRDRSPQVVIKIYEDSGHFIHRDTPTFSRDVLDFLQGNSVANTENPDGYQTAKKTEGLHHTVHVPPHVQAMINHIETLFAAKDIDTYMAAIHDDYNYAGRDKAAYRNLMKDRVFPYVSKITFVVKQIEVADTQVYIKGSVVNEYGEFPLEGDFVKTGDRWLWRGGER